MADGMSFQQYIANPSKGAAVVTNREAIKRDYQDKFDKLMVRENGQVKHIVFKANDNNDSYYVYLKIPSESVANFYYDVVVRLYTTENAKKSQSNLASYAVQFYSNDPAFVYTFAYAFSRNKLLIKEFSKGLEKSKIRNPKNEVWYVKSLYFAYLTFMKYGLFSRFTLDNMAIKYSPSDLKRLVADPQKKMDDRKAQESKLKELERKTKEEVAKKENDQRRVANKVNTSKTSPFAKKAGSIKPTKTVRATKSTKVATARGRQTKTQ